MRVAIVHAPPCTISGATPSQKSQAASRGALDAPAAGAAAGFCVRIMILGCVSETVSYTHLTLPTIE